MTICIYKSHCTWDHAHLTCLDGLESQACPYFAALCFRPRDQLLSVTLVLHTLIIATLQSQLSHSVYPPTHLRTAIQQIQRTSPSRFKQLEVTYSVSAGFNLRLKCMTIIQYSCKHEQTNSQCHGSRRLLRVTKTQPWCTQLASEAVPGHSTVGSLKPKQP